MINRPITRAHLKANLHLKPKVSRYPFHSNLFQHDPSLSKLTQKRLTSCLKRKKRQKCTLIATKSKMLKRKKVSPSDKIWILEMISTKSRPSTKTKNLQIWSLIPARRTSPNLWIQVRQTDERLPNQSTKLRIPFNLKWQTNQISRCKKQKVRKQICAFKIE